MGSSENIVIRALKKRPVHNMYFKVRSLIEWELHFKRKLVAFDNIHQGECCFILGNGPSLNKIDLSQLRGITCFGLNKIHMHPDVRKFGINYHVAVNRLVIEQSFNDFKHLNCPSFLSFRASLKQRIWRSPYNYIITDGVQGFSSDPYSPIFEGCTVTYVAMQLAYFMGFKQVYLVGVDHSFNVNGNPHEKQTMKGPDQNHFHPNYFAGLEWQLPDLEGSELAYRLARDHYRQDGREIYDATVGGKLNIFPKVEFNEAIASCRTLGDEKSLG